MWVVHYFQLLAGSTKGEFVNQIVKLNNQKPKSQQISQTKSNAIETLLEFSTIALMNSKSVKAGQFEIGYYSMIDEEKLVSVNSYIQRLKTALANGYLSWRISPEEVEKIIIVLEGYSYFHEPVTASILFVTQTECLQAIGCPLHLWYARSYYRALHNYLSRFSSTEKGECLQETEINLLLEKLLKLNIIDKAKVMRFTLEDKETCTVGNTLVYIKGDQ